MTYPVQPPEPPPIVQVVPSKQLAEPPYLSSSPSKERVLWEETDAIDFPLDSPSITPPSPIAPDMDWMAPASRELLPSGSAKDKNSLLVAREIDRAPATQNLDLDSEEVPNLDLDSEEVPDLDLEPEEIPDLDPDSNETLEDKPPVSDTQEIDGSNLQEPLELETPLEVTADYQTFDRSRQIFTAIGNVVMRYRDTVIDADWLQVNLLTRMARAEGNVALTQPGQVLRGESFRYNFVQEIGTVEQAEGEISSLTRLSQATPQNAPTAVPAPATTLLPVDLAAEGLADAPQSDRVARAQPLRVTSGGGFNIGFGAGRGYQDAAGGGTINSFRFAAEQVEFTPNGWEGTNVRITNDPFSPPELEIRANRATLTPIDPLRDELLLSRPRLVFDDGLALPILKRRYIIDRRERQQPLLEFGFDGRDRGGFFIQRTFTIVNTPRLSLRVAPQYFLQQAYDRRDFLNFENFGSLIEFRAILSPTTTLRAEGSVTNLDLGDFEADDDLRSSIRLSQKVGNHTLTGEYSFRNRLFNGSLGFQTVHSSVGAVLTSPTFVLGTTGISLNYQVGVNLVEADTDDQDLLDPIRDNDRATLTRFQGSMVLRRGFTVWQGEALPATATEGLRFSPVPVVPFARFYLGARGIGGFYSNGDSEISLRGTAGFQAQFGHFSRNFLDYTAFNIEYSETIQEGESPFFFDRTADRRVLRLGFTQQLFGPLRFGIQASLNLDTGENFSTNFVLEYSRRTHGIVLQINPEREIGSLTFRISDFDWNGNTGAFSDSEACQVRGGLRCVR
ncbi:MAG: DUF3769 domain-containing protein [Cyanobacteria bacterium SBC]|nr:DUF3769 domain-containing protein [Cyanobacteria bacterium SBC]